MTIDIDINLIFVTMAAGGGAGGIGYVKGNKYISGGGGSAGNCIIKKPIKVKKGYVIKIKVGKGGNSKKNRHGEPSYIKVYNKCCLIECIQICGGRNGYPKLKCIEDPEKELYPCGGKTKKILYNCCCFQGADGERGHMALPSQICICAGNGGSNVFCDGGKGGSNMFSLGGKGGCYSKNKMLGSNGHFGSGGGGSCPRIKLDYCNNLSGNGGNGFVLIEW
jgi:hypothetical protein